MFPDLHLGGQYQAFADPSRFKLLVCGRRWGKSLLAMVTLVVCALRGGRAWWVWPNYPMAMVGWRKMSEFLSKLIVAGKVRVDKQERMFLFPGGGFVQFKSAEKPDGLRGEGLDLIVMDELAYIKNGEKVWNSDLRPALSERMGKALLVTTPNGLDFVFEMYNLMKEEEEFATFQFPTWLSPYIPKAEIESARRLLKPNVFNQEYGAEFLENAAAFFANLDEFMTAEPLTSGQPGRRYVAGLDIGSTGDFTVLSIADVTLPTAEVVYMDRFGKMRQTQQLARILEKCARFDVEYMEADMTGLGLGLVERLQEQAPFGVEGMKYNNTNKTDMFDLLATSYEMGDMIIPKYDWLKTEHQMIRAEIIPGRRSIRIGGRSGFHDDGVNSIGLVNKARDKAPVYPVISDENGDDYGDYE